MENLYDIIESFMANLNQLVNTGEGLLHQSTRLESGSVLQPVQQHQLRSVIKLILWHKLKCLTSA